MIRFSTVICCLALGVSACDSEGIDRANVSGISANNTTAATTSGTETTTEGGGSSQQIANDDEQTVLTPPATGDTTTTNNNNTNTNTTVITTTETPVATDSDTDASSDNINMFGGSGSSDGGQNSNAGTNETDTASDNNNNAGDDINMLGGSGSSDGGNSNNGSSNNNDNTTEETQDNADASNSGNSTPQNDQADTTINLTPPTTGTTFVSTTSPIRYGGPECSTPNKDENNNLIFNGNCPTIKRAGNVAFGDFLLANNTWNDCASAFENWTQCISVNESNGKAMPRWDYDWGNESDVRGAVWLVKSYPEVIYGVKSPGEYSASTLAETVANTGMPAKVSNLPFYKISYTASSEEYSTRGKVFNGQTINGERNIAIESFFHELGGDCDVNTLVRNSSTSNQRFELMVWVDAGPERLPAAPNDYVTTTTIDGQQYDVYTKPSDREYIAFVAKTSRNTADLNWNSFIEWTREYSHRVNEVFGKGSNTVKLQDDWCLANILLGTEIWWGNGFFQLDDYTIQRTTP